MLVDKYDYEKGSKDEKYFRDSISTVDASGKRKWIYPKKPNGRYYDARKIVSYVLLILLFGMPFIKVNGQPLLLFNVLERKFILFGITFWPQDFHLFVLAMITFIVFIVLFTVIYGRLFCGWVCPQTIFMEMVFRRIEYWIEGSDSQQKKLNARPWDRDKLVRKTGKHLIFFAISFLIGNTFLAYIIGIDQLFEIVTSPVTENLGGFTAMVLFSGAFYFVFAYMREQVCVAICPYGRLQGVLLDQDSIVVAYDFVRGEPRGKIKKGKKKQIPEGIPIDNPIANIQEAVSAAAKSPEVIKPTTLGDCVDCDLCVKVCPTGIDIRNGTQLECINCTACIDACDGVMEKINRDKGLIRYASYNSIAAKEPFRFNRRMKAYSIVLTVLMGILGFSLASRSDVEATILRTPGMLYQEVDEATVSNLYNLQMVNKTMKDMPIELKIAEGFGTVQIVGKRELSIQSQGITKGALFVKIEKNKLSQRKTPIVIEVWSGTKLVERVKTNFMYK